MGTSAAGVVGGPLNTLSSFEKNKKFEEFMVFWKRLLGQRKAPNLLDQFIAVGMSSYARWIATQSGLP